MGATHRRARTTAHRVPPHFVGKGQSWRRMRFCPALVPSRSRSTTAGGGRHANSTSSRGPRTGRAASCALTQCNIRALTLYHPKAASQAHTTTIACWSWANDADSEAAQLMQCQTAPKRPAAVTPVCTYSSTVRIDGPAPRSSSPISSDHLYGTSSLQAFG